MQGPPLIVVKDTTDRGTILQHHILGSLVGLDRRGPGCLTWGLEQGGGLRRPPFGQDLPFDGPQSTDLPSHLHLGTAVGLEHGLGQIAQEVIGAIAVRNPWKLRGDPASKGLLFRRYPQTYRLAQTLGPTTRLCQQPN
jgi:hypothetical protein